MLYSDPPVAPDISVIGGDALFSDEYEWADADGVAIDLSSWVISAHWRRHPTSSEFILLTVDTSQAAAGKLKFSATPEQTVAMAGPGYWSILGTLAGVPQTFIEGKTTWRQAVTR